MIPFDRMQTSMNYIFTSVLDVSSWKYLEQHDVRIGRYLSQGLFHTS